MKKYAMTPLKGELLKVTTLISDDYLNLIIVMKHWPLKNKDVEVYNNDCEVCDYNIKLPASDVCGWKIRELE